MSQDHMGCGSKGIIIGECKQCQLLGCKYGIKIIDFQVSMSLNESKRNTGKRQGPRIGPMMVCACST